MIKDCTSNRSRQRDHHRRPFPSSFPLHSCPGAYFFGQALRRNFYRIIIIESVAVVVVGTTAVCALLSDGFCAALGPIEQQEFSQVFAELADSGGGAGTVGPWLQGTSNFIAGRAPEQSLTGSCCAACGAMLYNGSQTEEHLLDQIGEWTDPQTLANALNGDTGGPWVGGNLEEFGWSLREVLSHGPAQIELKTAGVDAHAVVADLLPSGSVLIRDPAIGASYEQPLTTVDSNFWTGRGVFNPNG